MSHLIEVPLTSTEEAYLMMVIQSHRDAANQIDAMRNARVNVLLADKGIPSDTLISTRGRVGESPAVVIYERPDIVQAPDPAAPEVSSEKSTAPDAQGSVP